MLSRVARSAVFAAFLIAVIQGPALALGPAAAAPGHSCCCSQARSCPRVPAPESATRACCTSYPPAAPANSGTPGGTERGDSSSPALALLEGAGSPAVAPTTREALRRHPARDRSAGGVGLYTLHAAFLI